MKGPLFVILSIPAESHEPFTSSKRKYLHKGYISASSIIVPPDSLLSHLSCTTLGMETSFSVVYWDWKKYLIFLLVCVSLFSSLLPALFNIISFHVFIPTLQMCSIIALPTINMFVSSPVVFLTLWLSLFSSPLEYLCLVCLVSLLDFSAHPSINFSSTYPVQGLSRQEGYTLEGF